MAKVKQIEYQSTLYDIEDAEASATLQSLQGGGDFFKKLCNLIYPVGALFLSGTTSNPNTLFGGTWTRLSSSFLKASTSEGIIGTISGSDTVTITTGNLPSHTHSLGVYYGRQEPSYVGTGGVNLVGILDEKTGSTGATGNGDPVTINPTHYNCEVWQRTGLYES